MELERVKRFADNGLGFITLGTGICNRCRHVHEDGQSCDAFPDGIPALVLNGEIDHRNPVQGDNGIQFERRQ